LNKGKTCGQRGQRRNGSGTRLAWGSFDYLLIIGQSRILVKVFIDIFFD